MPDPPSMSVGSWLTGLLVSLLLGFVVVRWAKLRCEEQVKLKPLKEKKIPPWLVGLVERSFFTFAVAFRFDGIIGAMIALIAIKLAANWGARFNKEDNEQNRVELKNRTFVAIVAGVTSMFFAMVGGLIVSNHIPLAVWLNLQSR